MKRIIDKIYVLDKSQWMDEDHATIIVKTKTNQFFLMIHKYVDYVGDLYTPTHLMITSNTVKLFDSKMNLSFQKQDKVEVSLIKYTELLLKGVRNTLIIKDLLRG